MTHTQHANDDEFQVFCDACEGTGDDTGYGGGERCKQCNGAGFVPTELGRKILELVRNNFNSMWKQ